MLIVIASGLFLCSCGNTRVDTSVTYDDPKIVELQKYYDVAYEGAYYKITPFKYKDTTYYRVDIFYTYNNGWEDKYIVKTEYYNNDLIELGAY